MNTFHWMAAAFLVLVVACLVLPVLTEGRENVATDSLVWAASVLSVFTVASLVTGLLLEVL